MVAATGNRGFLLDINPIIAALNEEPPVLQRLARTPSGQIFVPVMVLGRLYFGALKSQRTEANTRRIEQVAGASNVLAVDRRVSRTYGSVKDGLRRIGRPILENDIWIAATALCHDLTLVSRDTHFDDVDGLRVERW